MLPPHSNKYLLKCDGSSNHLKVLCPLSNMIYEVLSKCMDEVDVNELGTIPSSIEKLFNVTYNY